MYGEVRGERGDDSDEDMSDDEPILGRSSFNFDSLFFFFKFFESQILAPKGLLDSLQACEAEPQAYLLI